MSGWGVHTIAPEHSLFHKHAISRHWQKFDPGPSSSHTLEQVRPVLIVGEVIMLAVETLVSSCTHNLIIL